MRTGWRAAVGTGVFLFLVIFLSLAGGCGTPDDSSSSADSAATADDDDDGSPPGSIQEDDDNDADDDSADDDDDAADDDSGDDDSVACGYAPSPSDEKGVFVSAGTGNDNNPGTMAAPKQTIGAAVGLARTAGKAVFVAGGQYKESFTATVSIFGGYRAADWGRDPATVRSLVIPPAGQPIVVGDADAGEAVVLEGLEIHGAAAFNEVMYGDPAISAAVTVDGGNVVLSCNRLIGGSATDIGGFAGAWSIGAQAIRATSLLLVDNLLQGGLSFGIMGAESAGLDIETEVTQALAKRNEIHAGTAVSPLIGGGGMTGVAINSEAGPAKAVLIDNEIRAESPLDEASGNYTAGVASYGPGEAILIDNAIFVTEVGNSAAIIGYGPLVILQNTIVCQNEGVARVFWLDDTATLADNAILASGNEASRFIELAETAFSLRLHANDFFSADPGFSFVQGEAFTVDDLAEFNACQWDGCAAAAGNLSADPLLAGAADVHLQAGSPCIDQGVDPSSWYDGDAIHFDLDGDPRPQGNGWDIGADEVTAR